MTTTLAPMSMTEMAPRQRAAIACPAKPSQAQEPLALPARLDQRVAADPHARARRRRHRRSGGHRVDPAHRAHQFDGADAAAGHARHRAAGRAGRHPDRRRGHLPDPLRRARGDHPPGHRHHAVDRRRTRLHHAGRQQRVSRMPTRSARSRFRDGSGTRCPTSAGSTRRSTARTAPGSSRSPRACCSATRPGWSSPGSSAAAARHARPPHARRAVTPPDCGRPMRARNPRVIRAA